jgi:hypothetical protein
VAYNYKYARTGPPFNFLGHFSASQRDAFKEWATSRADNFSEISIHHRIRAQQLRKFAGAMEKFYASYNAQSLSPTFEKETWQPGKYGHFTYGVSEDHLPMVTMSKIKARYKEQLQRDEEAVFFMNHARHMVEVHEDAAQYALEFTDSNNTENLNQLLSNIDHYFGQVEYQSVLVEDKDTKKFYKGEPYFRVHPFDPPTRWELEQANHSDPDTEIMLKDEEG